MAVPLKNWLKTLGPLKKYAQDNVGKMWSETFMRDPLRAIYIDDRYFFTPADGIILYQDIVKPDEKIVEIKGMHYTLQDIMDNPNYDKTCLVIGIFMTFYDVHINRIPYSGMLKFEQLTPTMSYNKPMLFSETDIIDDDILKLYQSMNYVKTNARMLNTIYNPILDYRYYVTQIADNEVNVITHFTTEKNQWFNQNQRFSFVRWGSQCEAIFPIDNRYHFETLVPTLWHVECCNDPIVKITRKV